MQDVIIKEIVVKADKEQVYAAITDPAQIIKWFPDVVEGSLAVGERPIFIFTKQNHKAQIYVEAANPNDYFAYRWVPGGNSSTLGDVLTMQTTLVEFFIEEDENGTKVTVKESGFSSLPAEIAEESFKDNSGGWEFMMNRFENLMNQ